MAQCSTPITTASSAADSRLKDSVRSKSMRIKNKKSDMLKSAIGKAKVDGRGGSGFLGDTLKKITQNSIGSAKSMAQSVGNAVQAIGKAVPDPIGAVKNKIKEIITNQQRKTNAWRDKRNKDLRNAWRSKVPGKMNVDGNGVVHSDEPSTK